MATPALLDLEHDGGEDPMTIDIPVADPDAIPEDLGDLAPEGAEHVLADVADPTFGLDPVEIFPVSDTSLPPLGLNMAQRLRARDLAIEAAALAVRKHQMITYTMASPGRWDPIARRRKAWRGEVGRSEDCSSFATWCLWHGLSHFGIGDVVNGQRFTAGWTGTMLDHGFRVSRAEILRGDLLFYANAAGVINHVTIYVGGGMVISHGSEPGPLKLEMDYRPIVQIRRYIRD
jgi:hypothetical protein